MIILKVSLVSVIIVGLVACVENGSKKMNKLEYQNSNLDRIDFLKCGQPIENLAQNLKDGRNEFERQVYSRNLILEKGPTEPGYNSAFYDVEAAKDNVAIIDGQLASLWAKCNSAKIDDIDMAKLMEYPMFLEGTLVEDLHNRQTLDLRLKQLEESGDRAETKEIEMINREKGKIQDKINGNLKKRAQWRQNVAIGIVPEQEPM